VSRPLCRDAGRWRHYTAELAGAASDGAHDGRGPAVAAAALAAGAARAAASAGRAAADAAEGEEEAAGAAKGGAAAAEAELGLLLARLGAPDAAAAAARHRQLVERLERLDTLLPRCAQV
jgi:hypothetical protein